MATTADPAPARSRRSRLQPRRLAGVEGVWVFIGADAVIFALLFGSFMQDRLHNPPCSRSPGVRATCTWTTLTR